MCLPPYVGIVNCHHFLQLILLQPLFLDPGIESPNWNKVLIDLFNEKEC